MNELKTFRISELILGQFRFRYVKGIGFKCQKHPQLKLFVWQHDGRTNIRGKSSLYPHGNSHFIPASELKGTYCVVESTTGCSVAEKFENPEQAVFTALNKLNDLSSEHINQALLNFKKRQSGELPFE